MQGFHLRLNKRQSTRGSWTHDALFPWRVKAVTIEGFIPFCRMDGTAGIEDNLLESR